VLDSILYYSALFFGCFVRLLPLSVALWFGRVIGMIVYFFDFKNRAQTYANLKIAFAKKMFLCDLKVIAKQMYRNYGQGVVEMCRLPLLKNKDLSELIEIEGKEYIDKARQKGKGVILCTMHAGSWELASVACARLDFPFTMFANVQRKFVKLNKLLNYYRSCGGSVVLNEGAAVRDVIKGLRNNDVVGMVIDQGGRNGLLVPFFGRTASMNVGVVRLAQKYGAPIVFSSIHRLANGRHKMVYSAPINVDQEGCEKEILDATHNIVAMMEAAVREHPEEYMWVYKIWKYSKEAKICILSDGKIGHQRQSESVAQTLQDVLWEKRSIKAEVEIIKINYVSTVLAKWLTVLSVFYMPIFMRGRLSFLKYFLNKPCLDTVLRSSTDYVISCGSSVAGLNFLISKDHNSKSIVILKPGLLSYNHFDLVVLPKHDEPKMSFYRTKFVITYGALNLITPKYLKDKTKELLNKFSHLKSCTRVAIGVLIGGDSKDVYLSMNQIKMLVQQLKEVAENINADIYITTSRRTPEKIDHWIKKEFKSYDHCPLIIIPNEENVDSAVGGIMGLADVLLVSGDSLSMISEAATSGKKTIVFTPEFRSSIRNKHLKFIKKLSQGNFILSSDVKNIGEHIYDIRKKKIVTRSMEDNKAIYRQLCEVI
jgi:lauroyl/myristoyl acyltransferase/mitochondrial fission protein ELM1